MFEKELAFASNAFMAGNLAASEIELTSEELAELEPIGALEPEYPAWAIAAQQKGDQPLGERRVPFGVFACAAAFATVPLWPLIAR